ncbi:hypothetical protein H2200_010057 [Cladophialophora chaetospira]|uniref:Enoyl reductase (ER) domain-containing protein n=1 Tax=Cladophialophora chaetospira TaxID=386627 RepID=A0AA38X254_9EURO|nr:hypothetical protein H2200_010057 [Cladophialophora chaetospira]
MSATHQAAVIAEKGQRLTLRSLETPKPGPRELLISVNAIALNPIDYYMRDMGYMLTTYPATIGSDIAGTIEATGSDIPSSSPFRPGARILAFALTFTHGGELAYGASQQKVIVPIETACPIPDSLSFVDAATMPMGVLTALSGFTSIGLPASTTALYTPEDKRGLLIWGASSSIGMSTIQVAKALGFRIYATSSAKHHATLTALGAEKVFDYSSPTVVDEIVSSAKEAGVVLKTAYRANGDIQPILDVLVAFGGGNLASAVNLDASTPSHPSVVTKFVAAPQGPEAQARHLQFVLLEWLAPRLEDGSYVAAPRARVLQGGLGALNEGLDVLKSGVSGEKLVVEI